MYNKPFGSIFGDSSEPLKKKVPAKQVKPLPSASPSQDPIKQQKEELRKSKVIKPGDSAILDITSKDIPVTPELELVEATQEQAKVHLALERVNRAIAATHKDIRTAEVYRAVLLQYHDLSEADKSKVNHWVVKNSKAIANYAKARALIKETQLLDEKLLSVDVDIHHWDALSQLKAGNKLNVKHLKHVSGIKIRPRGEPAQFKAPPDLESRKLAQRARKSYKHLKKIQQTLGEYFGDVAPPKAEEEPDLRLQKPLKEPTSRTATLYSLPDYKRNPIEAILSTRPHKPQTNPAIKLSQARWADAMQLKWKLKQLVRQLSTLNKKHQECLHEITGIVEKINSSGGQEVSTVTASLGILTEGNPDQFLQETSLEEALKGFFTKASQLHGEHAADPKSAASESEKLLKQATLKHGVALQELQTRDHALATVQADVQGTPPPPLPIPVQIEVDVDTGSKHTGIKMNHVLIALGSMWILSKVL